VTTHEPEPPNRSEDPFGEANLPEWLREPASTGSITSEPEMNPDQVNSDEARTAEIEAEIDAEIRAEDDASLEREEGPERDTEYDTEHDGFGASASAFPPRDDPAMSADDDARRAIEAVVLAATEPVEPRFLAELVELPVARVEALCAELETEYQSARRGFVLARVAGGYRFQTHPDLAPYVERFVLEGQHVRLSGAALETLAIVAYKQPIARGQISAIRGVNVETTLQTLVTRGYVADVGRDPGPGLAVLYGTTPAFLERLGLDAIDDLPPLGDFVPDAGIVELLERGLRMPDDPLDQMGDEMGDEASPGPEPERDGDG
jgi:segregation and condensation protein B